MPYLDVSHPRPTAARAESSCPRGGVGLGAGGMHLGAGPRPGGIPAAFVPATVRLCRLHPDPVFLTGRGMRYTVSDLVGPVSQALLAALNLPDQRFHPRGNTACAANYEPPVYLLLIDKAGKAIQPQLPADPCGRPRAEVVQAIQSVQLSEEVKYRFIDAR